MDENLNFSNPADEAILPDRDYGQEVRELYAARPELVGQPLPQQVVEACVAGETLTDAYGRCEEEARIRRQNEAAAARAPVRSVTRGGGTDQQAEDAFLRGFNTAW